MRIDHNSSLNACGLALLGLLFAAGLGFGCQSDNDPRLLGGPAGAAGERQDSSAGLGGAGEPSGGGAGVAGGSGDETGGGAGEAGGSGDETGGVGGEAGGSGDETGGVGGEAEAGGSGGGFSGGHAGGTSEAGHAGAGAQSSAAGAAGVAAAAGQQGLAGAQAGASASGAAGQPGAGGVSGATAGSGGSAAGAGGSVAGSAGSAGAGGSITLYPAGQIYCGSDECDTATEMCCAYFDADSAACLASSASCAYSAANCDSATDCAAGQICCYVQGTYGSGINCVTDCSNSSGGTATHTQLCDPAAPGECATGSCELATAGPSWAGREVYTCQAPYPAGLIYCGSDECDAATEQCCAYFDVDNAACLANSASCAYSAATCDSATDCAAGEVCCYVQGTYGSGINCVTDCSESAGSATYTQLCDPLALNECVSGSCQPAASPSWVGRDVYTCL